MATAIQREHLEALMQWFVDREPQVHYAQVRPMRTIHYHEQEIATLFNQDHGITMDCSEGVTLLCKLAGLADPNGAGYDGTGYTGTLLQHLPHYTDPKGASVGALCVFGSGTGHHVAMVYKPGADPLLWSHGQERGPVLIRLSEEAAGQPPPVTFLNVSKL